MTIKYQGYIVKTYDHSMTFRFNDIFLPEENRKTMYII